MATYITITDSQLDPDAPLTSSLAYQWRDNPIAMFGGAVGAPRLQFAAIDTWLTTSGAIGTVAFLGQITANTTTLVAGTTYAGSGLGYAGFDAVSGIQITGVGLSGTWRALGTVTTAGVQTRATLFIRIA